MTTSEAFYRSLLAAELERRRTRNANYSLRAFARSLEMSPAGLSRVLTGQRPLSIKTAEHVAATLGVSDRRRRLFLDSVADDLHSRQLARQAPTLAAATAATEVNATVFDEIADWYYFAILELTYVDGFRSDPAWIASRLGVSAAVISEAIDKLLTLGLLEQRAGTLKKTKASILARGGEAMKHHQRQLLERGLAAIDQGATETRIVSTMMMPIDPAKLATARRMIEEFSWHLCRYLSDGTPTEVYALNTSLIPVRSEG